MGKIVDSKHFKTKKLVLPGNDENVIKGGKCFYKQVSDVFNGTKQIAFLGWGSQGPAQSQNLRDTLASVGSDTKVVIGLRDNSTSIKEAEKAGFCKDNGTLLEMMEAVKQSDVVIMLISDSAQSKLYKEVMDNMKSGATLGLSHGFLLAHMKNEKTEWRKDINVIMVAPKGMGPSVRKLYEMGKTVDGAGINSSIAIEQDYDNKAIDIAIAWAIGIGSPYVFETTLESEYKSDIFGERADLLGGVWALVESLYSMNIQTFEMSKKEAFINSVETITGPISKMISENGLKGLYKKCCKSKNDKKQFKAAYSQFFEPSYNVMKKIYDNVSSGEEIKEVIQKGADLAKNPMKPVDNESMWKIGKKVRNQRSEGNVKINPFTAGAYVAMIMAQVILLKEKGHLWSEIANESIIEATDSLNPYMHENGVAHMVDNCSVTARLGTRKWGPVFKKAFDKVISSINLDDNNKKKLKTFKNHDIHEVLEVVGEMRPTVALYS